MSIKRIRSPLDFKGIYDIKKLNFVKLPHGRKVFVEKSDKSVTFFTPNNQNLSKRCKILSSKLQEVDSDFLAEAVLTGDDQIVLIDSTVEGKNYAERINDLSEVLKIDGITKPCRVELKTLTENLTGSFKVIVDGEKDLLTYFYESDDNVRNVIIGSYYYGNKVDNEREVLFKCYQASKEKSTYVGKLRIEDPNYRKKAMSILRKKKRLVAQVHVDFDKRSSKKFSKINFIKFLRDEKFKDIVIDDELFFSPIQIFTIGAKSRKLYYLVEDNKNLNTVTGAI
tara:strand:+ start:499 stop:1344 length:846 start_codon:yes stop_codon:yes gene_type:complete